MGKKSQWPLKTTSYYVTDLGDLHLAKQGGIVSVGVNTKDGVVVIEMNVEIVEDVAKYLTDCLSPNERNDHA